LSQQSHPFFPEPRIQRCVSLYTRAFLRRINALFTRVRGMGPTASVRLFRGRSRQVLFSQRPQETRPQALLNPQLMAPVGTLPLPILSGHLPPRRSRPRHPQDAAEHSAVVEGWSAYLAALRRQQGTRQRPLLVGEPPPFRRDRRGLEGFLLAKSLPGGAFRGQACLAAAGRHRLVSPPPSRPPQQEASSALRRGHGEDELPRLRHRRRDQVGIETPFLWLRSSSTAALWRVTARKAWASRHRVTCRCQESHLLTS
jgi:hypothetical protein